MQNRLKQIRMSINLGQGQYERKNLLFFQKNFAKFVTIIIYNV